MRDTCEMGIDTFPARLSVKSLVAAFQDTVSTFEKVLGTTLLAAPSVVVTPRIK